MSKTKRTTASYPGIYIIRCKATGKRYVGQAVNIGKRWAQHHRDLTQGTHCNDELSRCFRRYGQKSLVFKVHERCPRWLLNRQEAIAIYRFGDMNEKKPRLRRAWLVMPWELHPLPWFIGTIAIGLVAIAGFWLWLSMQSPRPTLG